MTRMIAVATVLLGLIALGVWWFVSGNTESSPAPAESPQHAAANDRPEMAVSPPSPQQVPHVRAPVEEKSVPPVRSAPVGSTSDHATLVGRLVAVDGSPVRLASCAGWIRRGNEYRHIETMTDDTGRFAAAAPIDFDGDGRLLVLHSKPARATWGRATVGLPPTLAMGETWLGELPVEQLPQLVDGTVRDDASHALEGVAVYAMPPDLDIRDMRNQRLPESFRCDTDAQGRFRIAGASEAGSFLIVARRAGWWQQAVPRITRGATDVAITMAAAGALEGSVVLTGHIDPRLIYVELRGQPVDGHLGSSDEPVLSTRRPNEPGTPVRLVLDPDGRFAADLLRPGLASCAVRVLGRASALAEIDGLRIEPGATCADQRIQGIGLSALRSIELTFSDRAGAHVGSMPVGIREAGEQSWGRREVSERGTLLVAIAGESFDVLLQQRGYRRQVIRDVRSDLAIVLDRGIELAATVQLGWELPAGYEVTLRLVGEAVAAHPEFGNVEVPRSEEVIVSGAAAVKLAVPAAGTYQVKVRLQKPGGRNDESIDVTGVEPATLLIPDAGLAVPLRVVVGEKELEQAERTLRFFKTR